jgi:tetratricopeptide (TPR) repeat protein
MIGMCQVRRIIVSGLIAVLSVSLLAGPSQAQPAKSDKPDKPPKTEIELKLEPFIAKAHEHIAKAEWGQALEQADLALKVDPNSGEAFVVRGLVRNGQGDYEAAIQEFDKATAQTARDTRTVANRADAYANRSFSFYEQGEYLKAIDSGYFAILEKGDHLQAHLNRGKAYIARHQYDKAINSFNRAIGIDGKNAEAYSARGLAYDLKGNVDQNIADQKKALELDSKLSVAHERMALAKIEKKELPAAYQEIEAALQINPNFAEALCVRAQLFAMRKNTTHAEADLDKALEIAPKSPRVLLQRGLYYFSQNKHDKALEALDQAVGLRKSFAEAYCARGYVHQAKKNYTQAEEDFTKALESDPKMIAAYTGRSQAYKKLNKNAESVADANKAKDLIPPPPPGKNAKKKEDAEKKKLAEKKKVEPPENRFLVSSKGVDPKKRPDALKAAKEIDRLVAVNYDKLKIAPNARTTDSEFVRRIYLDITGTIPTYPQTQKFLAAKEADKRANLIDELLASDGYASHFFNYWADVLRYTDHLNTNVRGEPYRQWIKQSLAENKTWDHIVEEMLSAEGLVWENPATGYLQRDANMPLDNMNNTVRIFLGTRIGCAQCHNHPFDRWTQKEFYQTAAFTFGTLTATGGGDTRYWNSNPNTRLMEQFAGLEQEEEDRRRNYYPYTRLIGINQMIVNDQPARKVTLPANYAYNDAKPNEVVEPKTLFGKPADIKAGEAPRKAFARWVVSQDNPRFALTIANRLWKQAFGVGQIEPVDDMMDDTVAENPELMTFLESEMKRLNFDMKEYLRVVFNSDTYQRQACAEEVSPGLPYHFPGPILRRMTSEQLWDSFLTLAVVKPDEYREEKADVRTHYVGLDLNKCSAEDVLHAEAKAGAVDSGHGAREKKYVYKGALLGRASELPSPVAAGHFLRMFGQSDRELISASATLGSVPQVLFMFNGPITHMLLEKNSTIYNNVVKKPTIPEGIKVIFLTILNREPDEEELKIAEQEVKKNGPAGYGNVIWSLVNTREFLFVQ